MEIACAYLKAECGPSYVHCGQVMAAVGTTVNSLGAVPVKKISHGAFCSEWLVNWIFIGARKRPPPDKLSGFALHFFSALTFTML